MKRCKKCILTDNFYSVHIDDNGLCNYCNESKEKNANIRDGGIETRGKKYDVVLAYSGGKDSTYTLYLLKKKYDLNVLAIIFDNGYLSNETYKNIKNICANLDVDYEIICPSLQKLNSVFKHALIDESLPKKSLERASAICTYCISLVKMTVYKEAILKRIPYIAFGWTPGQINIGKQIVKLEPEIIKANFYSIKNKLLKEFGNHCSSLLLDDDLINENIEYIPSLFYPFVDDEYNEEKIFEQISQLGWKKPSKTDSNSTNCLLNSYAIFKHKEKYGFHPYAMELASLVREGVLDKEKAMERILTSEDDNIIQLVGNRLNTDFSKPSEVY